MKLILDSFLRAVACCLVPRVIALSLLPLVVMLVLVGVLGYFFWTPALMATNQWLDGSAVMGTLTGWLERLGGGALREVLAPLLLALLVQVPQLVLLQVLPRLHKLDFG